MCPSVISSVYFRDSVHKPVSDTSKGIATKTQNRSVRQILNEQRRFIHNFRDSIERRRQLLEPLTRSNSTRRLGSMKTKVSRALPNTEIVVSSHHHVDTWETHGPPPEKAIEETQVLLDYMQADPPRQPAIIESKYRNIPTIKVTSHDVPRLQLTPYTKRRVEKWLDSLPPWQDRPSPVPTLVNPLHTWTTSEVPHCSGCRCMYYGLVSSV